MSREAFVKMKLLFLFLWLILLFSPVIQQVLASSKTWPENTQTNQFSEIAKEQLDEVSLSQIEKYWIDLRKEYGGFFPEGNLPHIKELMVPTGNGISVKNVFLGIVKFFVYQLLYSGKLLTTIVVLTMLTMLLETIQAAFEKNTVSKIAYSIAYMVLIVLAINSFRTAITYAGGAINSMVQFMMAMVPLLLTLLTSTGGITTVTVLHPLVVFIVNTTSNIVHYVIFPFLFFSAVLHLVSTITEKYKATQLANFLRHVGIGLLGVLLSAFLGILSVQGATGAVADGVALRTAKYVTGTFVPVVGNMFSDATDTIMSASLLVKNAVGIAGVIILLLLCAFPALKILALSMVYSATGALMQPLGDSPIVRCLQTIGKTLLYVFAALAAVGLMFFLAVTIILTAGSGALLFR